MDDTEIIWKYLTGELKYSNITMTDSEIIWKYLNGEIKDDHPAVYLYCCGNARSPKTAKDKLLVLAYQVFAPAMPDYILKATIHGFLENKKKLYMKGLIKVKPLYST